MAPSHRAAPQHGHSHGHGHGHGSDGDEDARLEVARLPRSILLTVLVMVAVATVVGAALLWPQADDVDAMQGSLGFAAEGVTFPQASVDKVQPACPVDPTGQDAPATSTCGHVAVTVDDGADDGKKVEVQVPPEVSAAGLARGDRLELLRTPAKDGAPVTLSYFGIARSGSLWILVGLFALVVVAVARLRGLMALVGLGVAGVVIGYFMLPGLLTGENAVAVALVSAAVIMYVVLYSTHGVSLRTSAALAGTLAGVAITAALGRWAVGSSHLTGVADEGGTVLSNVASGVDLQNLLIAAVVIAGLGVLNDVTITQASAVWELRSASPGMSRATLFASAMRIGRDHIASTIYTIIFAYAGTALTLLLVVSLYDRPWLDLVGTEEIAGEVVRALTSSIGLVLAVPLTTAIAVLTVPGPPEATPYF